jgi:hypothetical protein
MFRILGFHCDNGSEFLNHRVAKMLEKLLVEFTKSRAYRTTDNALVEGKNGAVVRKHVGYGFIASEHAEAIHRFFAAHLNPYLNYHRPCGFAELTTGVRGRLKRRYPANDYRTPFEKEYPISSSQIHSFGLTPYWNRIRISGSLRIGIIFHFQAHFWIGKCCDPDALGNRLDVVRQGGLGIRVTLVSLDILDGRQLSHIRRTRASEVARSSPVVPFNHLQGF